MPDAQIPESNTPYLDLLGRPFSVETWNCWTLCREVYRRGGILLPAYLYVPETAARDSFIDAVKPDFQRIDVPQALCLVLFRYVRWVTHVGVVLPDCKLFIHARRKCNTSIEPLVRWRQYIEGYYVYAPANSQ